MSEPVPVYEQTYTDLTISTNGLMTLGNDTVGYNPRESPTQENTVLIAPLWSDYDTTNTSAPSVYYTKYEKMDKYTNLTKKWKSYLDSDFTPSWAVEAVWSLVPLYPAELNDETQNVTFKAILLTDGDRTYLIYEYVQNNMLNNDAFKPYIGWNANNGTHIFWHPRSGNVSATDVFVENGNAGPGIWVWPLFDPTQNKTTGSIRRCRAWINSEINKPTQNVSLQCPCNFGQAQSDLRFKINGTCANLAHPNGNGYGLHCCYDDSNTAAKNSFLTSPRGPSAFYRYHPSNSKHQSDDLDALTNCCVVESTCDTYYKYRPVPTCSCNPSGLVSALAFGSPHIKTFDGLDYTFAGAGEFIMIQTSNGLDVQGRLEYQWIEGDTTRENQNTTIFTAFAVRNRGSSNITIQLNEKRYGIEVFVDGIDVTSSFNGNSNFDQLYTDMTLYRKGDCAVIVMTNEFSAQFCPVKSSLEATVMTPGNVVLGTKGLFGNANQIKSDDLTLPNNIVLPENSNQQAIFEGMKYWNVSEDVSIFRYPPGLSSKNFSNPAFIPSFLEDNLAGQGSSIATICRNKNTNNRNFKCEYDIIIGKDEPRANVTVEQEDTFVNKIIQIGKNSPCLKGDLIYNVTVNETFKTYIEKPNGTVNISCILPPGAACNEINDSLIEIVWTPQSSDKTRLGVVVTDSDGNKSPVLDALINMCDL
ncbi:hypothetical protein KUTeg_015406 [Tegillarca granosa]|uniref:VWFD domain-containing protein n=1 Tax=Tegillarca granosa TaxID=220873 RepID=A0ABQ9ETN5_TEGGR|nr:hypothetical protein KUTeg_015406 [Tegillarca granosa]